MMMKYKVLRQNGADLHLCVEKFLLLFHFSDHLESACTAWKVRTLHCLYQTEEIED